jgi:hypothetical protein
MIEIRLLLSEEFVFRFMDPARRRDQAERMKEEILSLVLRTLSGNNELACYSPDDAALQKIRTQSRQHEKTPRN